MAAPVTFSIVSLAESSRPDPLYVRTGGREGFPMGDDCPMCLPGKTQRRKPRSPIRMPEPSPGWPPKNARHAWLPP
jgi:hypothetical protein